MFGMINRFLKWLNRKLRHLAKALKQSLVDPSLDTIASLNLAFGIATFGFSTYVAFILFAQGFVLAGLTSILLGLFVLWLYVFSARAALLLITQENFTSIIKDFNLEDEDTVIISS